MGPFPLEQPLFSDNRKLGKTDSKSQKPQQPGGTEKERKFEKNEQVGRVQGEAIGGNQRVCGEEKSAENGVEIYIACGVEVDFEEDYTESEEDEQE